MPVYLRSLALRNYRGIGNATQKMPSFKDFNFFIGANNTGKSTVLNFISKYLPINSSSQPMTIEPLEYHGGQSMGPISMALGFTANQILDDLSTKFPQIFRDPRNKRNISDIIDVLADEHQLLWRGSTLPYPARLTLLDKDQRISDVRNILDDADWNRLWAVLNNARGGDIVQHWIPQTIDFIEQAMESFIPRVRLIPAIRQIRPKSGSADDFSGAGLIDRLAEIQNPEHNRREGIVKFHKINEFLQFVTGRPTAAIEIPYSREHILVHMDDRILPLSNLGTGIHEVVMIAAFCTLAENENSLHRGARNSPPPAASAKADNVPQDQDRKSVLYSDPLGGFH